MNILWPIKILHIEDDEWQRVFIKGMIEDCGFDDIKLDQVASVPDDLKSILHYDGILLDHNLPGVTGIDAARRLHYLDWRVQMFLLTAEKIDSPELLDIHMYVNSVCQKDSIDQFMMMFRSFVRNIRAIREAGEICRTENYKEIVKRIGFCNFIKTKYLGGRNETA